MYDVFLSVCIMLVNSLTSKFNHYTEFLKILNEY